MIPAGLAAAHVGFTAWRQVWVERLPSFENEDLAELHVALSALHNEVEAVRIAVRDVLAARLAELMDSIGDTDVF